jgi:type IV secretion system protein VirB6
MSDFLGTLLDRIDASGNGFSEAAYNALSVDIAPLFRLMFTLYVGFYGLQLVMGTAKISVADITLRITRVFFILVLISAWGNFDQILYSWITSVPEAAGRAILAATGTGVTEPTNGLSDIWATANEAAAKYSEQSGYFSVLPAMMGFMVMVVVGFFVATALAILILSKVMMWILIGTAPIFIALFLFEKTMHFGMGWLNQVFLYALIPLFVYAVAAFLIAAINPDLAAIGSKAENNTLQLSDFAAFILLCLAGGFVMLNIQTMAAGITGAVASAIGAASGRGVRTTTIGTAKATMLGARIAGTGGKYVIGKAKEHMASRASTTESAMQRNIQNNSNPT